VRSAATEGSSTVELTGTEEADLANPDEDDEEEDEEEADEGEASR